jgi:hypothetical protein
MEGGRTPETSVYFNEITQRYILEGYVLDSFCEQNTSCTDWNNEIFNGHYESVESSILMAEGKQQSPYLHLIVWNVGLLQQQYEYLCLYLPIPTFMRTILLIAVG